MKVKHWTTTEITKLRDLVDDGYQDKEISVVIGRTRNAIAHRRFKLRMMKRPRTKTPAPRVLVRSELVRLHNDGLTNKEIAAQYGVHHKRVYSVLYSAGVI